MMKGTLILPFVAILASSTPGSDVFGESRWGAKSVAIERLQKRASFPVLLPERLASRFKLVRAEIVWVPPTVLYPKVASRQAVSLRYRLGEEGAVVVIQTSAVQGADPGEYLRWVAGSGYFYESQPDGSLLQFGTRAGRTDFSLIGVNVTRADLDVLSKALITSAVVK